jgi:hypothetical protein
MVVTLETSHDCIQQLQPNKRLTSVVAAAAAAVQSMFNDKSMLQYGFLQVSLFVTLTYGHMLHCH